MDIETDAPTIEAAVRRIREWRVVNDIAPSRLANDAGLSEMTTRKIDTPDWNPSLETLRKLSAIIPADWRPESRAA